MTVRAEPRFVVARRDLRVTSANDVRSRIREGQLVRADHAAVLEAPDEFYAPCVHRFHLEISEYAREDGSWLGKSTETTEIADMPPPGPRSEELWANYWRTAIEETGFAVLSVEVEQLDDTSEFIVRASVDRAAPPSQTPEVYLDQTMPQPMFNVINAVPGAKVEFVKDSNGAVVAAHFVNVAEPPAPVVNVNVQNEPGDATVKFKRDRDGRIVSAKIIEEPDDLQD